MEKFRFIDLFAGIGGFHVAMESFGGQCVFASDIDPDCRTMYAQNFGIEPAGDITKVNVEDIPAHDVLCAGFPCQSFSKAGNRLGVNDPRGTLFFDIVRIAEHHKPKYMLLENVRNLAGHDGGNTWKTIHHYLTKLGYSVSSEPIIFSPHYIGIPQHRERVFILCVRKGQGALPELSFDKTKKPTCNAFDILEDDARITDLQRYKLSQTEVEVIDIWNDFIKNIKGGLPGFPVWSEWLRDVNGVDNIDQYPKWKQDIIVKNSELYKQNKTFINKWLTRAQRNTAFTGAKAKFEWQAGKTDTPNLWDNLMHFRPSGLRVKAPTHYPALVAITQTSIVGPRRRRLTPRECAALQSFPKELALHPNPRIAYRQLGNSVNVEVVKRFAGLLFKNI